MTILHILQVDRILTWHTFNISGGERLWQEMLQVNERDYAAAVMKFKSV